MVLRFSLLSLLTLLAGAPAVLAEKDPTDTNRYNVLLITIDDLRNDLGESHLVTPNMDRLAKQGVAFDRHYTAVPTCGASRYALLTGRSPASSGLTGSNRGFYQGPTALNHEQLAGAQSLPELFRRSGYRTVNIGKISHTADGKVYEYDGSGYGQDEVPHAWDELATPYGPWERGWGIFFAYANGKNREDGEGHEDLMEFVVAKDEDLPDGLMATAAINQLAKLKKRDEPFFLGVGFFKPHLPFVAPREDWEAVAKWDVADAPHPEPIDSTYSPPSGEFYRYEMPFEKTRPLAPEDRIKARRAYLACVRYVDRQVGRVLDALEKNGLAEETIVVLWSDHGYFLGELGIWGKHTTLERAARAPLIIRAPEVKKPGRRSPALVESIDIFPTLVDLARPAFERTEHPLDGQSLLPILRDESATHRDGAFTYWRNSASVRTATHRLIATRKNGAWEEIELFDLTDGPEAIENIADTQPDQTAALLEMLKPAAN